MAGMTRRGLALGGVAVGSLAIGARALGQAAAPVTFTAEQDQRNMMDRLGIRSMRPSPSGREDAPNPANYDESIAGPTGDIPDVLRLKNGRPVTTPDAWWKQRRPQIAEDFEREVYGRIPADVPKVTWEVVASEPERLGFTPVNVTQLVGRVENSAYPAISVNMQMTLVLPAQAKGPVPVLIMFGRAAWPSPRQPSRDELARINAAMKAMLADKDPSLRPVFEGLPAYQPFGEAPMFPAGGPPPSWDVAGGGWGFALLDTATIQADSGDGLTRGIIGLTNKGQPRKVDDWGALRAWGWGASRALDYLQTRPEVDAKRIGVEGVSRYGKAALVAAAFDQRFGLVLVGSSGKGGATLHRRNFGEAVETLTSSGEYHWFCGNYLRYGAAEPASARRDIDTLPVDSHELIAMVAPRPCFISYGIPESGDAKWLDQRGSWMAAVAAGRVYRLLGAKDLGVGDDWRNTPMPPVLTGLLDGELAWRQHDGGHTDGPNIRTFVTWADKITGRKT
ncbi:acetylxylan esterase [Phenylobacterium deserti]|nr:acetylxylan esterase [Phenylobacterium deserti]